MGLLNINHSHYNHWGLFVEFLSTTSVVLPPELVSYFDIDSMLVMLNLNTSSFFLSFGKFVQGESPDDHLRWLNAQYFGPIVKKFSSLQPLIGESKKGLLHTILITKLNVSLLLF